MKTPSMKSLVIAAVVTIAPAGAALAAQDCTGDAFARYNMVIAGEGSSYHCVSGTWDAGAQGPSGPVLAADTACGRDPFDGYRRAFNTGGPAQLCGTALIQSGAQGPAGPTMAHSWSDPFAAYQRTFPAD